jgi:hypothetical protein
MDAALKEVKCETALNSIAPRYRDAIGNSYRTDWVSAFPLLNDPAFDGRAAGVHVNQEEHPMTNLSKTRIAVGAFAVNATSAFSEAAWDFKAGTAYVYGLPGKMSAMAMASTEKNHEVMMKKCEEGAGQYPLSSWTMARCTIRSAGSIRRAFST